MWYIPDTVLEQIHTSDPPSLPTLGGLPVLFADPPTRRVQSLLTRHLRARGHAHEPLPRRPRPGR